MGIERHRELRRRRKRTKKMNILKRKVAKANASEKTVLASKIRRMTPGCEDVIANLALEGK